MRPTELLESPTLKSLLRFVRALAERARALRLPQAASSLAYLSLLALVPVASIGLAVLTMAPAFAELRIAFEQFLIENLLLPQFSETVIGYLNQFTANAEELSLLGLAVFGVSATFSLVTIEQTLNDIWATDAKRSLLRRVTLYWTMLTLGPLLIGASLALSSYLWTASLAVAGGLEPASRLGSRALPFVLMFVGLTLLYRLVPAAPVRWRDAAAGAFLAALVLELLKRLLGLYFGQFSNYTVVYGAFATLPIFLVWLYALWMVVLAGALIAANLRHWRTGIVPALATSPAARFETALGLLAQLVHAQRIGTDGVSVDALRARLGSDSERAARIASALEAGGYLRRWQPAGRDPSEVPIWDEMWALAQPAEALSARSLFEVIWSGGSAGKVASVVLDMLDRPLSELVDADGRLRRGAGSPARRD